MAADDAPGDPPGERWLAINPTSGAADHRERVRRLAAARGYRIEETTGPGDAARIARDAAAAGADLLAVCGGDGTLNEAVGGLVAADATDDVTVGVVPTGTANLFAGLVGVDGVEEAFDLLDGGRTRRIDLGMAGREPFVVSCIAGLPADASAATSAELKSRFGTFAFVLAGVEEALEFEGLTLDVTAVADGETTTWSGEALCALVGNLRRFTGRGGQANAEDGLLDVVIIERMPPGEAVAEAIAHRLLGERTEHVVRARASRLSIESADGEPITFSFDGEIRTEERLSLHVRPRALSVRVGPEYDPAPDGR